MSTIEGLSESSKETIQLENATVRFAGDSGDGMQLAGTQLTNTSALAGCDVATFPDFPAEIRAPRGTLAGVSGFQVHFASTDIFTPGDELDALVAMNPAALKSNVADLKDGGTLIVDEASFTKKGLEQAGYETNPLEDHGSLSAYKLIKVDITKLTRNAVAEVTDGDGKKLSQKAADRCRNFCAMGLIYWLYGRSLEPTLRFINDKFGKRPHVVEANTNALKAGWNYGETTDAFVSTFKVDKAKLPAGKYRNMMGNEALAWGLVTAAKLSNKELFLGSYPITPASDILHYLAAFKNFGVKTFQAEDEIAAVTSTIGAAFGGSMAITTSSGPGIALKGEAMGLGVMLELPMLIINIQRGGPSTGLPTKTEQSDLYQAMFGRNGECPMPVIAARSPSDCFEVACEAWRISSKLMMPVMILSDGYIANGSEPWKIVDFNDLEKIEITHPTQPNDGDKFQPYMRDDNLARPWAVPGTPGLMHRVGGLEKDNITGNVSYDPDNHHQMCELRDQKVKNVANFIGPQEVHGPDSGDLLVLTWGGTYGSNFTAVKRCQAEGLSVSHCHLRWLNPFPSNLGDILKNFKKVLIPELNRGQLRLLIRAEYLCDAIGFNKVMGKPFTVTELVAKIKETI